MFDNVKFLFFVNILFINKFKIYLLQMVVIWNILKVMKNREVSVMVKVYFDVDILRMKIVLFDDIR